MPAPKCVEFSAVFDDGTVKRWDGSKADRVWSAMEWDWLDPGEQPVVTNPMRKVTTFDADYLTGYRSEPDGFFQPEDSTDDPPWRNMDEVFVPEKVCGVPGVVRRFRITVEAIPIPK